MANRTGKHKGNVQQPSTYQRLNDKQEEVSYYNRAMKRRILYMSKKQKVKTGAKNQLIADKAKQLNFTKTQIRKLMRKGVIA